MSSIPGLVTDPNVRDVASTPITLSPQASALLEELTRRRDTHNRRSISYSRAREVCEVKDMTCQFFRELKKAGLIEHVGFTRDGVIVEVLPPFLRVGRR